MNIDIISTKRRRNIHSERIIYILQLNGLPFRYQPISPIKEEKEDVEE